MSNNRKLVSDIRELDKGITECENFLAKVLNRKTDLSRQAPANKKKNVPSKSASRPQSRGAQTLHQRTPSAGANSTKDSSKSNHSVRKSVPTSASKRVSPERLSKPKSNDGQRRRSNSASRLTSHACRCEPTKPVSANKVPLHIHLPNSSSSKESQGKVFTKPELPPTARPRSPDLRNKHLSWGAILRENHPGCSKPEKGHWDIGGCHLSGSRPVPPTRPPYSTKLPHECEPIKECSSQSSECTAGTGCNHFFKVSVATHHQEESFSSEGTSGFSSNNDLPSNLTNKSIQCGLPIPVTKLKPVSTQHFDHRRVSSSSSGASSQKEEKEKVIGVLGSDVFTMFNPVRTLNFLIKELQGMVQKHPKEDGSICRIIADMEKVLHRLPESGEAAESSSGYTTRSKPHDSHSMTSTSSRSCDTAEKPMEAEAQKTAALRALQSVPALAKRIDERIESMKKKICEAKTDIPVPSFTPTPPEAYSGNIDNILQLQRYVENSGHQLDKMCQSMEQTCEILRNERDALREKLEERDKKLQMVKSQEQDFVTTIASLRTNLESASQRVTQLSVENKLLKEQVKLLPPLQESDLKLKKALVELNALHEEVKELPFLRAGQAEVKILTEKLKRLEIQNEELPALKYIEEKYKEITKENSKLREENKIIPVLRVNELKVAELTSELANLKLERKNLEETVARNNEEFKKLKGEIQNPIAVTEATRRLTLRLQDTMKERDDAQHDLQMLRIEREKLMVLTQTKNEELSHFVEDILNIKRMVTDQLEVLKANIPKIIPESISDVMNSSSDSDEMTSARSPCQPVCSSPTSSASAAPNMDDVWQDISTIIPEQTRSSPEILVGAQRRQMEEADSPPNDFQSIARDTWQSATTAARGEACVPQHGPPQSHAAGPIARPVANQNMVVLGDNQWCGATAVTQELQHNVEELFRLIKSNSKVASSSSDALLSTRVIPSPVSSVPSSRHPMRSAQSAATGIRNIQFEMPKLPDPPKFLEAPEFSDFSSYHGSLADTSSVESIDAMLKELEKDDPMRK